MKEQIESMRGMKAPVSTTDKEDIKTGIDVIAHHPAAQFEVDLTKLSSDSGRRDASQRGGGLQTNQFPTATFRLTAPITLPSAPGLNVPVKVQAAGDLTLHGVTKPVTAALKANWTGELIDVAGSAPIVLSDFGIEPPSVGGFVEVADEGVFEVQLTLVRT